MAIDKLDNRNRLLQQMGLIYSQIMDLNEQMTEALQNAVDIDISVTGGVSDITKDFMEGFHYKIDEHSKVVSEQKKWEYDQLPPVKEIVQQKQDAITPKRNITQEELNKVLHEQRERHKAGNYEPLDLSNCVFNNLQFTGNLSDILFMNSEFNACTFRNTDVENSNLSNAEFMNTAFSECTFDNSIFYGAGIGYCTIEHTIYTDCVFNKAALVACEIDSSGMNGCNMGESIVSDTKFTDVMTNDCKGTGTMDFSGIDRNLRNSAENIFIDPKYTFDYSRSYDLDNMIVMIVHSEGEAFKEQLFEIDYNLDTHKIDKISGINNPELSVSEQALSERGADMLRMNILRGFQDRQFHQEQISRFSPCVMVKTSEVLGIKENTLYDLKEFSDRLESYGRVSKTSGGYDKVNFTVMFDTGDGSIRKYHDIYDMRSDKDSLIEILENSKQFNNAEIQYLKNYISGENSPIIDTTKVQNQEQDTVHIEQETPQKESSRKEKHQSTIPAKYVALVYVKGSDVKTRVTGASPEKIIELCQKWNTERSSDNQLGTAYIKKYNFETKAYENFGKYDISKGVELQPIYLELPSLGKEKFGQMVSELKTNGAKYNPEMKKWYITQACNLSLFKDYLPKQSEPQIDTKGEGVGKKSVIDNLSQNKSSLVKNTHTGNQPQEQQRKQDAPER